VVVENNSLPHKQLNLHPQVRSLCAGFQINRAERLRIPVLVVKIPTSKLRQKQANQISPVAGKLFFLSNQKKPSQKMKFTKLSN